MNEEIINAVNELSWEIPKERQKKAIKLLVNIEEENYYLLFDKTKKSTWENVVVIIKEIGFPKNKFFIPILLWLLKDVNWPGASKAMEILTDIDEKEILNDLENAIKNAYLEHDTMWMGGLNMLIKTAGYDINAFSNKKTYEFLQYSDF